ncbi:MAG TPA: HAD family hydrolase [Leptospiraceae bacterium]|nr:HAD family hydrolase [Leptospiraceae bacterium]
MTLFLDLDNTLYDAKYAYSYAISKLDEEWIRKGRLGNFISLYEKARQETKADLKNHSSNRLRILYFKKIFDDLEGKLNIDATLELEDLYFKNFIQAIQNYVKANQANYKTLFNRLKEISNHHKIFILTNENLRTQLMKLGAFFPMNIPIQLLTSEEIGREKPSLDFFKRALKLSGSKPSECLMVGDNLVDDIKGALGQKIPSVFVKTIFGEMDYSKTKTLSGKKYTEVSNILKALTLFPND